MVGAAGRGDRGYPSPVDVAAHIRRGAPSLADVGSRVTGTP